ncbi:MAG TPA: hypothetical protein VF550_15730, partial [Polyangia bacterium]
EDRRAGGIHTVCKGSVEDIASCDVLFVEPWCSRASWMMGMRADSTMGITRLTVACAVSVMPIVESARQGFSRVMAI